MTKTPMVVLAGVFLAVNVLGLLRDAYVGRSIAIDSVITAIAAVSLYGVIWNTARLKQLKEHHEAILAEIKAREQFSVGALETLKRVPINIEMLSGELDPNSPKH